MGKCTQTTTKITIFSAMGIPLRTFKNTPQCFNNLACAKWYVTN